MSNVFSKQSNDPLVNAAAAVLFNEDLATVKATVAKMKPGDVTNFGTVKEIGDAFISFKARDTGVTKIALNQRKMGSKDFVLDKLIKLKEDTISETPDSSPMAELNKVRASIKGFEAKLKNSPDNEDLVKMLKNLRTKETMLKKQVGVKEDLDEAFDPNIVRITNLPGSKLEAFFVSLSDGFMDIYDDDNSRVDAKHFAAELMKLSKLAKNVN